MISKIVKGQIRTIVLFSSCVVFLAISLNYSYLLFHVFAELFSVVIAFSLFTVTWNTRKTLDNQYLFFIGITAFFIGVLDTFHIITYQGMNIIQGQHFYANQFWIATRFLESLAILVGFAFLKREKKINPDILFFILTVISVLIVLSILYWEIFPVCFIKDVGQTKFKIYSEYVIIIIFLVSLMLLKKNRSYFEPKVYKLVAWSIIMAIVTEFCFTLYVSNFGVANQIGHFSKLITFFLIYKANVETGFVKPAETIFSKLKKSEENFHHQSTELVELNKQYLIINEELKNTNEEVQSLNTHLASKNEILNELNATKDKFFSIIAHDLKNPFNALLGFAELLVKNVVTYPPQKAQQMVQIMHDSLTRTYALLENLLEWSRLQNGTIAPNQMRVKPSSLINEAMQMCEQSAESKNIKLQSTIHFDESIMVDSEMIKTVLRNLITNAIKFTYPHGTVHIETQSSENAILFTISDTGIGIEQEHLNKLFRIDSKLSKSGTANESGTGLGLILCKELVDKHNGEIWVESEPGKGSKFKFTIPSVSVT